MRSDRVVSWASEALGRTPGIRYLPDIPLKMVLSLSDAFPAVDLGKEELYAVVRPEGQPIAAAVTSNHLYGMVAGKAQAARLNDGPAVSGLLDQAVADAEIRRVLQRFLDGLGGQSSQEGNKPYGNLDASAFDDFIGRMKQLGDVIGQRAAEVLERRQAAGPAGQSETGEEPESDRLPEAPDEASYTIDRQYLDLLRSEGDQLWALVRPLNADAAFMATLQQAMAATDVAIGSFGAQHVVLQDLIRIYNLCDSGENAVREAKGRFALAYLFERMQEKDMAALLSLPQINELVGRPNFPDRIEQLKQADYLKLPPAYDGQLVLPALLSRMKHGLFSKCSAAYIRFANLLLKADGELSATEEDILKRINRLSTRPKVALSGVVQSEVPAGETLEDVLKELHELIGMDNIKSDITSLINFLKIQRAREEAGLSATGRTLHAVFMGPPGTGKTTIARLLARIYKHLGYLESGHLVETDRAGLVAGYVGQTAIRVDEVVKAALGGVLFIDEAYALSRGGDSGRDFGSEAVEALLKRMEDHRKDLVVIVAGYPDEMQRFIESNPGLQSRFNRYFKFNHYTGEELLRIFKLFATRADFTLSDEAEEKLSFILDGMFEQKDDQFGNARVVRNLFEEIVTLQANRLVAVPELTRETLMAITEPDIPPVKETIVKYLEFGELK